jgi:hypothetical protein
MAAGREEKVGAISLALLYKASPLFTQHAQAQHAQLLSIKD